MKAEQASGRQLYFHVLVVVTTEDLVGLSTSEASDRHRSEHVEKHQYRGSYFPFFLYYFFLGGEGREQKQCLSAFTPELFILPSVCHQVLGAPCEFPSASCCAQVVRDTER